jgi:hypothetical protein
MARHSWVDFQRAFPLRQSKGDPPYYAAQLLPAKKTSRRQSRFGPAQFHYAKHVVDAAPQRRQNAVQVPLGSANIKARSDRATQGAGF